MSERWTSPCGLMELRLGRWQDVLADVEACDALISDPPYSERTHRGERGLRSPGYQYNAGGKKVARPKHLPRNSIAYEHITNTHAAELRAWWSDRIRDWVVLFADHVAFRWHEHEWAVGQWATFAPVIWLRNDAPPRFSGDGPDNDVDHILVARRRKKLRRYGNRPGVYHVRGQCGRNGGASGVVGQKDLGGMRALLRDYSEPGDLIVDPYAGTGTTLLAAAMEGRRAIGAEMDPHTYRLAVRRLSAGYTPQLFQEAR